MVDVQKYKNTKMTRCTKKCVKCTNEKACTKGKMILDAKVLKIEKFTKYNVLQNRHKKALNAKVS